MINVIIPLAGPDFHTDTYGIKPMYAIGRETIIEKILNTRFWLKNEKEINLIFILREQGEATKKCRNYLEKIRPNSKFITLSTLTNGALLSVASAISLINDLNSPIVIDLADIFFDLDFDINNYFKNKRKVLGVVPYFYSNDEKFSYLLMDDQNNVLRTKEKEVISNFASTGVYVYKNVNVFLECLKFCMSQPKDCMYRNNFFVCPSMNALINKENNSVKGVLVNNADPVSRIFH